ncbi:hypothetical protein HXX76_000602 [Chlamydomonas incerta]|uniref:Uncharacterized protein n=1 Tax=Chlamydomonas incerta TaxID=51695 RepID=A0A835WEW5_CHLIN|nr:hypothetical protein HXX76_000602 [Chlamydomonas incerta]|eukprot:KAG2445999.1 hypothetical protein HXX76_000602 [Chlamydomonas incerta]
MQQQPAGGCPAAAAPEQQPAGGCPAAAAPEQQPLHIRHPNGLWARSWLGQGRRTWGIARWVARWLTVRKVLTLIVACAVCGYGTYPVSDELAKWGVRSPPTADSLPLYSLANHLHPGPMAGPDGTWLLCPTCSWR